MIDPFSSVLEFLKGKSATLSELEKAIETDDLVDILNGMVVMKKIAKTGHLYHDPELVIQGIVEKTPTKRRTHDDEEIDYPEYVTSAKEKIDYLIHEAPLLKKAEYFTYYEEDVVETGREIHDVLCSQVVLHEVTVTPDTIGYSGSKKNVITNNRVSPMGRGFGFQFRDGKFRLLLTTVKGNREVFFENYDEVKKWLLKNL